MLVDGDMICSLFNSNVLEIWIRFGWVLWSWFVSCVRCCCQCDQIGRLLKVLCNKFSFKLAQIFGNFGGYSDVSHFLTILGIYWTFWVTFNSNIWSHWSSLGMHGSLATKYEWKYLLPSIGAKLGALMLWSKHHLSYECLCSKRQFSSTSGQSY